MWRKNKAIQRNFQSQNGEGEGEIELNLAYWDCLACKGVGRSWGQPNMFTRPFWIQWAWFLNDKIVRHDLCPPCVWVCFFFLVSERHSLAHSAASVVRQQTMLTRWLSNAWHYSSKAVPCVRCTGLWTVRCTVRYAFYCTYRDFVNNGVFMILVDGFLPLLRQFTIRCMVWCQADIAGAKWSQKGLSAPKPPIFAPRCAPPMCW